MTREEMLAFYAVNRLISDFPGFYESVSDKILGSDNQETI